MYRKWSNRLFPPPNKELTDETNFNHIKIEKNNSEMNTTNQKLKEYFHLNKRIASKT